MSLTRRFGARTGLRAGLSAVFGAAARPGWRWLFLAATCGALVALGQAPFGLWALALVAFAGVLMLAVGQHGAVRAGWIGWAAGTGYAAAAMFWIVEPFFVEPDVYGWMAPFALVLMAAGMGLFWALATAGGAVLAGAGAGRSRRALAMALGFGVSDLARGYLFTGFPWVLLGHVWIDTPIMQAAAFVGPVGLTLIFALPAAAPALAPPARKPALVMSLLALTGLWLAGQARLDAPDPVRPAPLMLRLVQPNAAQSLKWQPDMAREFFFRHLDLTSAPFTTRPDLIVWPETAVPFLLDDPGQGLAMVAEAAAGVPVALGIQRSEGSRFYNSLAVIAPDGAVEAVYDKFHLVPFGEYIPFGDLAGRLGMTAFAAQAGNGYSAGPGAQVLDLGRLGLVQPLICYEAVFPQDLLAAPRRADWLLQVTN
ncbi:apolipoprotein N-acyltransferase, partial [Phaeovulum sp.]|uniref:apolipoprotein N-acyltransferase n=1 Tax=Phaeovulum sp. TaxID=2934796 RepID=UPI0039E3620A